MARGPEHGSGLRDWRIGLGIVVGLIAAGGIIAVEGIRSAPVRPGPVLSDCDGALREIVIQYVPRAAPIVQTTYAQFLRQLPEDVVVHVVCPDIAAFNDLRRRVGDTACQILPVPTGHAMTCWSRDRWLAMQPEKHRRVVLLAPREEEGEDAWPERKGDRLIAFDLARSLDGDVAAMRSRLAFDGGDFVASARMAVATPSVRERNLGTICLTEDALHDALTRALGRDVLLLDRAPPHHAGMFMMPAGDDVMLVGDPSLAAGLLGSGASTVDRAWRLTDPDFTSETQALFDAVAERCEAAGFRVVRMPVVPGRDGRTWLTPLNAILDERDGRRIVYMPVYEGAEPLNAAAEKVWQRLGYIVRRVDCTDTFAHFGSLRCLVNVLRRG